MAQYRLKTHLATSAADTLTEGEIILDQMEVGKRHKSNGRIKLPVFDDIFLYLDDMVQAAADIYMFQITSQEKEAEVDSDDSNCVYKFEIKTIGAAVEPYVCPIKCPMPKGGIVYPKNKMWLAVDTDSIGATVDFHFEIFYHYEWFHESEVDKLMQMID